MSSFPLVAADKSGVSPTTISVPKGPGSIEGLGESFQPSLNTGTAKYGIGLKLPPGVAGHAPSLGLSYEGGGGNGPLGYGWNLSLPCIQRRTDKGIPTYDQDLGVNRVDTFINEMKEEFRPQNDRGFGEKRKKTMESPFPLIWAFRADRTSAFRLITRVRCLTHPRLFSLPSRSVGPVGTSVSSQANTDAPVLLR